MRGSEGMMLAIKWAREQKIPFLGICFGFQLAVVEWARNVCGLAGTLPPCHQILQVSLIPHPTDNAGATSGEFNPKAEHPIIIFMPEISKTHMGGTMRLGLRPTVFEADSESWSKVRKLYAGAPKIWERHRHRYEVNPAYIDRLTEKGLHFVGKDERGERMQVLEQPDHPYFVGFQAHPEFCTRPLNPSPPFLGFVAAASGAKVLEQQIENQLRSFKPPHPEGSMVDEAALRHDEERPAGEEAILSSEQ